MDIREKYKLIKVMRRSKKSNGKIYTYAEIGKKFKISPERVRQILNPKKSIYCRVHKVKYYDYCESCYILKTYLKVLSQIVKNKDSILREAKRLSYQSRNKDLVLQRILFIKVLRDKLKKSFSEISLLLHRDNTSIKNLYTKQIKI